LLKNLITTMNTVDIYEVSSNIGGMNLTGIISFSCIKASRSFPLSGFYFLYI